MKHSQSLPFKSVSLELAKQQFKSKGLALIRGEYKNIDKFNRIIWVSFKGRESSRVNIN